MDRTQSARRRLHVIEGLKHVGADSRGIHSEERLLKYLGKDSQPLWTVLAYSVNIDNAWREKGGGKPNNVFLIQKVVFFSIFKLSLNCPPKLILRGCYPFASEKGSYRKWDCFWMTRAREQQENKMAAAHMFPPASPPWLYEEPIVLEPSFPNRWFIVCQTRFWSVRSRRGRDGQMTDLSASSFRQKEN